MQSNDTGKGVQSVNGVALSRLHQELTQSLNNTKNAIKQCINTLQSDIKINPSLLPAMEHVLKDVERSKEIISMMKKEFSTFSHII